MQWKADLRICHMPNPTLGFFVHLMFFQDIKWTIPCVVFCRKDGVQSTFICFTLRVNVQKRDKKLFEETGSAYNNVAGIA